jgi:CRISPR/Cas system-associated exonuclease Cas4 (RecB family)
VGKNLKDLHKDFPDGQIINQEGWVESITVPGTSVFIKGKYDLLVKNPDGTHTMVDLKISQPHEDKVEKYQTQLWAYKYALEHPKTADPLTITKLALLIFYPDEVEFEDDSVEIDFPPKWLEVTINDEEFLKFMSEVNDLLTGPVPEENPDCKWCQYRRVSIPRSGITPT